MNIGDTVVVQLSDEETITAASGKLAVKESYVKTSEVGVAGGVASLDSDGLVPSSQLPAYVDDVLEFASKDEFPTTGELDKIYVATNDNTIWRWSGSTYIEINSSVESADVAAKLGTSTVGGTAQGIWLSNGSPQAMSASIGSTTKPAYMDAGVIKACGSTLDVDISGNAATADSAADADHAADANNADNASVASKLGSSTVGSGTNPIFLSSGTATASTSTVGSTSTPVYLDAGTFKTCNEIEANPYAGVTAGSNTNPVYVDDGTIKASTGTVGNDSLPVYLSGGNITECGDELSVTAESAKYLVNRDGTQVAIGSGTNPVFFTGTGDNGGVAASTSTVGSRSTPVYLSSGTITACDDVATLEDVISEADVSSIVDAAINNMAFSLTLNTSGELVLKRTA